LSQDSPVEIFLKKSLPAILISGIPRVHVAASLRRTRKYLASRCF
jgi:hypothetical protein